MSIVGETDGNGPKERTRRFCSTHAGDGKRTYRSAGRRMRERCASCVRRLVAGSVFLASSDHARTLQKVRSPRLVTPRRRRSFLVRLSVSTSLVGNTYTRPFTTRTGGGSAVVRRQKGATARSWCIWISGVGWCGPTFHRIPPRGLVILSHFRRLCRHCRCLSPRHSMPQRNEGVQNRNSPSHVILPLQLCRSSSLTGGSRDRRWTALDRRRARVGSTTILSAPSPITSSNHLQHRIVQ